ncbi:aldo-keto reductase [Kwoniella mangroviensis CBS 10435]|uniref:Aldo-keto reductase n=1 Tax=Kwoniella mangroviensis CBS 10435 TaxID=1331196 RepID=A0A1B9IP26_9TREE|nr:aldo-keto reductase [Kwoniella mangroviensis CBS 8507]OCF57140.1 aldo-keto reductase [Kwoniella mangroviensis CBS 10435]OCF67576.1 aldo-keto reductase [Kwoniella mangroviensis CBS 8507]OCF72823.1 aldo-keto reductase [Kwoniella mangroviensis CBS 8886]
MAASVPSFKLNTGATIPAIGLGTWQAKPGEVRAAVAHALKSGYRHIDGALCYQNEKEVGEGIKDSGVPRSEIFLTSKVWSSYHDRVEECLDQTLSDLGTDYLDLYLIHWPVRLAPNGTHPLFPVKEDGSRNIDWEWDQAKTWEQMEAVLAKGKVKAIGISNAGIPIIEKLLKTAKVTPAANQIELHPYNPEHELVKYCQDKGILVQAYSPLGSTSSPLHKDEVLTKIAEKHGESTAAILLSYLISKNVVVLPKSVTPSRIESNLKAIKLDASEVEQLDKLAESGKQTRVNSPPWGSDFGFPNWYGPNNKNAPEGARLLYGKSA